MRQGCPLSPYLFVIAINEISIALQEAMFSNSLEGISLGYYFPPIHSLLFADDLLLCRQANMHAASTLSAILHSFCSLLGQTPNWSRSGIFSSKHVQPSTIAAIKNVFPVPDIDASFVHLGYPLILPAKDRTSAYDFVLDKFKSKLSTYKADKLSHAARLELIQSDFASIPIYYMSNIFFF
jgi:mannosylglycoprotein endo-beta-mannosidase